MLFKILKKWKFYFYKLIIPGFDKNKSSNTFNKAQFIIWVEREIYDIQLPLLYSLDNRGSSGNNNLKVDNIMRSWCMRVYNIELLLNIFQYNLDKPMLEDPLVWDSIKTACKALVRFLILELDWMIDKLTDIIETRYKLLEFIYTRPETINLSLQNIVNTEITLLNIWKRELVVIQESFNEILELIDRLYDPGDYKRSEESHYYFRKHLKTIELSNQIIFDIMLQNCDNKSMYSFLKLTISYNQLMEHHKVVIGHLEKIADFISK